MKKTIVVSVKTPAKAFEDFKKAYKAVSLSKLKGEHYEFSFDSKKEFDRFVKYICAEAKKMNKKP